MPQFIALVKLSSAALEDLAGPRHRFEQVRRYLARRGIRLERTFHLEGSHHLLVLDSPDSPTRLVNRALARAWPDPAQRPGQAKLVNAHPRPATATVRPQPALLEP